MLRFIREKSEGWFAWTIVIAICITFILWGIHSYLYGNQLNNAVASVNGTKITQQQFQTLYRQLKRQQQMQNPSVKQSDAQLKQSSLESLISSLTLTQAASNDGFRVGDSLAEISLLKMPVFQENGIFSKRRFEQVTNTLSISITEFLSELKNNILLNQIRSGLMLTAFALPNEMEHFIRLLQQTRQFNYAILSKDRYLSTAKPIEQDIAQYYQSHQADFQTPEKVSLDYVALSLADLIKEVQVTDQDLNTYYQNNLATYTQPKQWKVATSTITVTNPNDTKAWAEAENKSRDLASTIQKKKTPESFDVKWVTLKDLQDPLKSTLAQMAINAVTTVKTNEGFMVIKLLETKPEKVTAFNELKDRIAQSYRQQKAEQQFSSLLDQLSNLAYENPTSLEPVAKQLGLSIQHTGLFARAGGNEPITQNPKILSAAFDAEVLQGGNNSEPINLTDNTVVVLRVHEHQPAAVKSLKSVKNIIDAQLKEVMAKNQAKTDADNCVKALNASSDSLSKETQHYRLEWKNQPAVTRYGAKMDNAILEAIFHLPKDKSTIFANVQLSNGDMAIVRLLDIKEGELKKEDSLYSIFSRQFESSFGLLDYQLYVNGKMSSAKIERTKDISADNHE